MIARTLTNAGDPLVDGKGDPLVGVKVTFTLVDQADHITDGWDAGTRERIAPSPVSVLTNEDGEFTIALWPNDRGVEPTFWRCEVDSPEVPNFRGLLPDGGGDYPWFTFRWTVPEFVPAPVFQDPPSVFQMRDANGVLCNVTITAGHTFSIVPAT